MNGESRSALSSTPPSTSAATGVCPECDGAVSFSRVPRRHEVCRCAGCGAELEVTTVEPLALQLAPEIEEDWGE